MKILTSVFFLMFIIVGSSCKSDQERLTRYIFTDSNLVGTIYVSTSGCFGTQLTRILVADSSGIRRLLYITSRGYKKVELDPGRESALSEFLTELQKVPFNDGCTNTSSYEVDFPDVVVKREDFGCSWDGLHHLVKTLFRE